MNCSPTLHLREAIVSFDISIYCPQTPTKRVSQSFKPTQQYSSTGGTIKEKAFPNLKLIFAHNSSEHNC